MPAECRATAAGTSSSPEQGLRAVPKAHLPKRLAQVAAAEAQPSREEWKSAWLRLRHAEMEVKRVLDQLAEHSRQTMVMFDTLYSARSRREEAREELDRIQQAREGVSP